jgi:hypothetical protein
MMEILKERTRTREKEETQVTTLIIAQQRKGPSIESS